MELLRGQSSMGSYLAEGPHRFDSSILTLFIKIKVCKAVKYYLLSIGHTVIFLLQSLHSIFLKYVVQQNVHYCSCSRFS